MIPEPWALELRPLDRLEIARNWLPRYTGMPLDDFGDYILLTNFSDYLTRFARRFDRRSRPADGGGSSQYRYNRTKSTPTP